MDSIEIRIKGQLNSKWSEWLEGLEITYADNGETILSGLVRDQAAMNGLLDKLFSLGVRLISVSCENKPVTIEEGEAM